MANHIIMYGDPRGGFFFAGPFPSDEDAADYAGLMLGGEGSWWVAPLEVPDLAEARRVGVALAKGEIG